jgi:hypothetical protein
LRKWKSENGKVKSENGKWKMENGKVKSKKWMAVLIFNGGNTLR